jgi:DNA mismatch repair ATPase MutS
LNVAKLANLPADVIAIASEKSKTMEEDTKSRELQRWYHPSCNSDIQERKSTRTSADRKRRRRVIARTSKAIRLIPHDIQHLEYIEITTYTPQSPSQTPPPKRQKPSYYT